MNCSICDLDYNIYFLRESRVLRCGHGGCSICLDKLHETSTPLLERPGVICPVCQKVTETATPDLLPTNVPFINANNKLFKVEGELVDMHIKYRNAVLFYARGREFLDDPMPVGIVTQQWLQQWRRNHEQRPPIGTVLLGDRQLRSLNQHPVTEIQVVTRVGGGKICRNSTRCTCK